MYWRYFKYILRHKLTVFRECRRAGIWWRGVTHDLSKFRPSEFFPYARRFYGPNGQDPDVRDAFNEAFLLHIIRNKHHWQRHVLMDDGGEVKFVGSSYQDYVEMVCDWIAMSLTVGGGERKVMRWFLQNRDTMLLDDENVVLEIIEDLTGETVAFCAECGIAKSVEQDVPPTCPICRVTLRSV